MSKLKSLIGLGPKDTATDKLAGIIINLLDNHPELWKFSGTHAEFEEYFCKVDFSSVESLTFSMRTQQHQAMQNNVAPSKFMRKRLMKAVLNARDTKMLDIVSRDLYSNQKLLLESKNGN